MERSVKDYILLGLKGMGMGAADVVPGVSGGTIAFITGIYEEFLNSIKSINFGVIKVLRKEGIKAAWKSVNGSFLLTLFAGIGISILSLAKLITYLLENHPILVWSFFFGLIVASILFVGKSVKKWGAGPIIGIVLGAALAFWITTLRPGGHSGEYWYIFVSGMIAICAMILPGISGSFILVLLGSYATVLGAIDSRDFIIIGLFAAGAICGLVTFSRVLSWLFKHYHDITIALLTGFLVGSLNKIWPWKKVVEVQEIMRKDGVHEVIIEENTLPNHFMEHTGNDPQLLYAILLALGGFLLIFIMERVAAKKPE